MFLPFLFSTTVPKHHIIFVIVLFFIINLQLKSVVSDPSLISFQTTTVLSEQKVSCHTIINDEKYVIILNPDNPSDKQQLKMNAGSVAAHPSQNILAVSNKNMIQIFNLSDRNKICDSKFPDNVEYMTWVDSTHLGVVTSSAVFHVDIAKSGSSKQIFERSADLANHVIVNYQIDKSGSWTLLHGNKFDV